MRLTLDSSQLCITLPLQQLTIGQHMKTTAKLAKAHSSRALGRAAPRNTDTHIEIGMRLKHARLSKGFSLRQLADEVGCTEGFLSKIENNKARPSLAMLHRLVSRLEIAV